MLGDKEACRASCFTFGDQNKPGRGVAAERLAILLFGPVAGGGGWPLH